MAIEVTYLKIILSIHKGKNLIFVFLMKMDSGLGSGLKLN
jgi:hypothetical protein